MQFSFHSAMHSSDSFWLTHVKRVLNRWIDSRDRMLIAVSGGADSVGLLSLLLNEAGIERGRIHVGHVNHGIRRDAAEDEELVEQLCRKENIAFSTFHADVLALATKYKMSVEAAARKLRYEALTQMAERQECRWILTGHTVDDSAETVMMRMLLGSPWYEWTGIPSRRGHVLRPLIWVQRNEIRDYVNLKHLRFRDDPTNTDPCYLRNRLRSCLSRKQEFWNDKRIHKIAECGQLLWWCIEAYREAARKMLAVQTAGSGRFGLEIERILGYFNSLTFVPVEVAWSMLTGKPDSRLSSAYRRQINDFLHGKGPQACLNLNYGIMVHRRGKHVDIYRDLPSQTAYRIVLGNTEIFEQYAVLSLSREKPFTAEFSVAIDSGYLDHELWLRNWQPGDRIKPLGRPTKKVADLLTERKANSQERKHALVLADDNGPLWLIGGPVAERALPQTNDLSPLWVSWKAHDGT